MTVSGNLKEYLRKSGFDEKTIAAATPQTKLLHDLGQSGDDFFDTIEVLNTKFGVDLTKFDWGRHTPAELHWDSLVFSFKGVFSIISSAYVTKRLAKYEPVTLHMIEEAMRLKRWDF